MRLERKLRSQFILDPDGHGKKFHFYLERYVDY